MLTHIKETYRNPILQPESTVSPEEAQVIVSLCGSAITQMALKIIDEQQKNLALVAQSAAGSVP